MNKKDLYCPYVNENGRKVSGAAAHMHHVKTCGGIEGYNKKIITSAVSTLSLIHI